jgi:hypothetical protein
VSTLLHATVYVLHNLQNELVLIANKMGLQKEKKMIFRSVLRTDDIPPIVVISLQAMFPFPKVERFLCQKIPAH